MRNGIYWYKSRQKKSVGKKIEKPRKKDGSIG